MQAEIQTSSQTKERMQWETEGNASPILEWASRRVGLIRENLVTYGTYRGITRETIIIINHGKARGACLIRQA